MVRLKIGNNNSNCNKSYMDESHRGGMMKMKSASIALIIMMIIVIGCTSQSDVNEERLKVGFAQSGNPNPWFIALTESMADEAERRGVDYFYTDANDDLETHVSNIEDMLELDLDYIVIAPIDSTGLETVLEKAQRLEVRVVLTGRTTEGPYITTVFSDQAWEGERCAEVIGKDNPKAKIVELRGIEGTSSVEGRASGFRKILEEQYPDTEIIYEQTANFNMTEAMEFMSEIIAKEGANNIDVVFAHNDNMALGAIQAIKDAGLVPGVDIKVIGIDGQKEALDAIIEGEMMASIQCSPKIGPYVFDVIDKLENGEVVEKETIVPDIVIDKINVTESYESSF